MICSSSVSNERSIPQHTCISIIITFWNLTHQSCGKNDASSSPTWRFSSLKILEIYSEGNAERNKEEINWKKSNEIMIQSHPFSIMECKVFSFRSSILHMVFVSFICSCTRECGMNFISIEIEFVHVSAHFSTCYTVLGALFIDAHDVRKPCERFGFRQVKNIFLMIWGNVHVHAIDM